VLVVLVVAGYALYRHGRAEPLNFKSETVSRGDLTQTVTATGTLNPVTSVQVGCQVSGTIQTNYVDFNSQVKAGQLISQIDPRLYQAQVAQAEADLANATANLELQQVQTTRSAELYTNHLVSASDYDTAVATLHQAEAMVKIKQALLDNVGLFSEQMREMGCLDQPFPFASEHSRVMFFTDERRAPEAVAHDATRCEVVLMSGLPGTGKDHHIREHLDGWEVISLDEMREEMDVDPADGQGEVINAAREQARELLRKGRSFVWNATNLSRQLRTEVINLIAAYKARVRIVYLEVPSDVLADQNRRRSARVPEAVIERLLDRWEVPDLTEAHEVECVVRP